MKIHEEDSKMEVSPYLSAIQALKGKTASEKYKELHSIAAEILKNDEAKAKFLQTGKFDGVPAVLCPTLQTLIGMRLKSNEAVVNALKSSDSSINKQGLKAKWFFKVSNVFIDINYLMKELLPFISLQTRLELIKKLGKCLKEVPEKATVFYQQFAELYGNDQTLPLLFACSEDFIYQEILKRKITLKEKMLKVLYDRYPQLAVRYLQLGNPNYKINSDDRALHSITLSNYSRFFPTLVKNHVQEFIEFFGYFPDSYMEYQTKLGNTRTTLFLKNATDALIEKPHTFLPILPLELVTKKLSKEQFDTMFQNLFPKEMRNDHFYQLIEYLKYYPKEKVHELFSEKYRAVYGKDLMDYKNLLDQPFVRDILPLNMRIECYKDYDKDKSYRESYMQPKDAIPLLKEKIDKTAEEHMKQLLVSHMIYSCRLYEDKEGLLEVLNYYNQHLKNEPALVLQSFLERLCVQFDAVFLEKEHWKVLGEIMQRAAITGDLFAKIKDEDIDLEYDPTLLIGSSLAYFLKQCQKDDAEESDKQLLETFINIALEYFCEHDDHKKSFDFEPLEIPKDCLHKFLLAVPLKYPKNHAVWKNIDKKLNFISDLICSMVNFNNDKTKKTKLSIEDYPWLKQFSKELLEAKSNIKTESAQSYASFKAFLRRLDLNFYQSIIDNNANLINEVTTNDALAVLKKDTNKILEKCSLYLSACKESLLKGSKAAKRFVAATRWYQEIPLRFVDQCLKELDDKGNLLILAILLEGGAFEKIIEPFLSKKMEVDGNIEDAKKSYKIISNLPSALKLTNPPVSLDALLPLLQDEYSSLALQAFTGIAQKTPVDCVLAFANKLMNKSELATNIAVNLVFQVATKSEACNLLLQMCKDGKCLKDKKAMAKMVFHLFTQTPSQESWQLMKNFIQVLGADDQRIFSVLQNIKIVNSKYVSDYTMDLFTKINELTDLKQTERAQLVASLVSHFEKCLEILSEDVLTSIIKEYFFDLPYEFLFDKYLFSNPDKFESRLNAVIDILTGTLTELNEPDPKKPRLYPAKQRIHKFFSKTKLFDHLAKKKSKTFDFQFSANNNDEMKLLFINRMLEIPSLKEDLPLFINLNIYKIYFEESDPKKFGEKCGKNVKELIEVLNKQYVINQYGDTMRNLVSKFYLDPMKFKGKELAVIDGLKSYDIDVSIPIGIKLLDSFHVRDYDERYDDFIDVAKKNCDVQSRSALNKFLARVPA